MTDKDHAQLNNTASNNSGGATDSIVLEEEIDPNYVPSEDEVLEYAKWLGMDLKNDTDLFWVAKEGLMAPLPKNWKPCKTKDTEDIYYFNFATGESTWDHPCDGYYKRLFEEEKKKKEVHAKESSDQNRTQAKADVEKLLGKADKKKKTKKTDIETLPKGPGPSVTPSVNSALAKPVLGPIAGSNSAFEKKPLPGISGAAKVPLKSQSEVSLLSTGSDASGASGRTSGLRDAEEEQSLIQSQSGSTIGAKKSKMSLRLSTVVATSDENQLDVTPKKSNAAVLVAEAKVTVHAEAAQTKHVTLPVRDRELASPAIQPSTTSDVQQELEISEAKPTGVRVSMVAAAKPTGSGLSRSAEEYSILESKLLDLERDVRSQVVKLESSAEALAEAERRVARAGQRQAVAEEMETALHRQLKDAKEQHGLLESLNNRLAQENKELRVSLHEKTTTGAADQLADEALVTSLREEMRLIESAERRAVEMQRSLREELTTQSNFYETKIRSGDLARQAAEEEVVRLGKICDEAKRSGDEAMKKHSADAEESSRIRAQLQAQIETLHQQVSDATASAVMGQEGSSTEVTELRRQIAKQAQDLHTARDATEDARSRCKRFEQLAASWEADCADRESRLATVRARVVEVEGRCHALESENLSLRAKLKQQVLESESSSASNSATQAKLQALLTAKLELEEQLQAVLALSSTKQRENELLQQRIAECASGPVTMEANSASMVALQTDLGEARERARVAENQTTLLQADQVTLQRRCEVQSEKIDILQGELDKVRELYVTLKSARAGSDSSEAKIREQVDGLERDLADTRRALHTVSGDRDVLRLQVERSSSELDIGQKRWALVDQEVTVLRASLQEQIVKCLELQTGLQKAEASVTDAHALHEVETMQALLRSKTQQCREVEETLNQSQREHVTKSAELAKAQFAFETERRARQLLESELLESNSTITRLRRELSAVSQTPTSTVPLATEANGLLLSSGGSVGLLELGVKLGQQSSAIMALEQKLTEANANILNLKTVQNQPTHVAPVVVPASATATVAPIPDAGFDEAEMDKSALIREMMLEFLQRRKPLTKGEEVAEPVEKGQDRQHWRDVVVRETHFLAEARRVLREEKAAIRWEQQLLVKRREAWRAQRQGRSPAAQQLLNQQTTQLNLAVEHARRTTEWLSQRERKLGSLQQLAEAAGNPAIDLQLTKLAVELDSDTLDLGLGYQALQTGMITGTPPLQHLPYESQAYRVHSAAIPQSFHRNTYLEAQTENARPISRRQQENMQYLESRQEQRRVSREVQNLTQERMFASKTCDEHIGWLANLRKDISNFQQTVSAHSSKGATLEAASAIREKFDL